MISHFVTDRPVSTVKYAENILLSDLDKPAKPRKKTKVAEKYKDSGKWKERYLNTHLEWFTVHHKTAFLDGHYVKPKMPNITTGNGLNQFIINFLTWMGHRATRINVQGRMIKGKYIRSTTTRGYADIDATIEGKSCKFESKAPGDKPSEHQIKMQERERKSGGVYEFIEQPILTTSCSTDAGHPLGDIKLVNNLGLYPLNST